MPRISEFYEIVISMYYREHEPAHFHATYGEHEAVFGIDPLRLLEGWLPSRVRKMVDEWASLHQAELLGNWRRARRRETPIRIAPLD